MKTSIATLALVAATATASGAAAQSASFDPATVIWSGTATGLEDGCVFTKNENGEMSYTENADDLGGVWEVTKRAKLNVSVRGQKTSLLVVADQHIVRKDGEAFDLTTNNHVKYSVNTQLIPRLNNLGFGIGAKYSLVWDNSEKMTMTERADILTKVNTNYKVETSVASEFLGLDLEEKEIDNTNFNNFEDGKD